MSEGKIVRPQTEDKRMGLSASEWERANAAKVGYKHSFEQDGENMATSVEEAVRAYRTYNPDEKEIKESENPNYDETVANIIGKTRSAEEITDGKKADSKEDNTRKEVDTEIYNTSGLGDKARLAGYRAELGFEQNLSEGAPDAAYSHFVEYAQAEGSQLSPNAAFTQSRIFQQKLDEGMSPAEAFKQSGDIVLEMLHNGHTYESIVASVDSKSPLGAAQIDWLMRYGSGAIAGPNHEAFTVGQRDGESVESGNTFNPFAAKTAARLFDANGKLINPFQSSDGGGPSAPSSSSGVPRESAGENRNITLGYQTQSFQGRRLMYTVNGQIVSNTLFKSGKFAASTAKTGLRMAPMLFYMAAGEQAKGVRQTQDALMVAKLTIGITVANKARQIFNMPLSLELRGILDKAGVKTLDEYIKNGNAVMRKAGIDPISTRLRGRKLSMIANQRIRMIRKRIKVGGETEVLKNALEQALNMRKAGLRSTFAVKPRSFKLSRRAFRISGIGVRKMIQLAGDDMRGVQMLTSYTRYAMMGGKAFFRAAHMTAKAALGTVTGLVNASGWLAAKAGRGIAKLDKAGKAPAGLVKVGDKLGRYSKNVTRLKQNRVRFRNKRRAFADRWSRRIRDPFGVRSAMKRKIEQAIRKAAGKASAKFGVVRGAQKVISAIARAASFIATALSTLTHFLLMAGGAFLLLVVVIMIVGSIIAALLSVFDFSSYKTTVQEYIVQTIEECYSDDMNKIIELSQAKNYQNVTIDRDDTFKDTMEYTVRKEDYEADAFIQSSNCAEIISMTLVRFGYDVEGADDAISGRTKKDIQQYIRELWYGSHEIYCYENTSTYQNQTGTDESGNPVYETVTSTSLTIVYRTYYFDYLFDENIITLGRSSTPVIYNNAGAGGEYGYVLGEDSIYVLLRDAGFSHAGACGIMGNIQQESSFNPLAEGAGGEYFGLIQWSRDDGKVALQDYCIDNGLDYTTATGQMNFLLADLEHSLVDRYMNYSELVSLLKGEEYANDPKACASFFAMAYERCMYGTDPYEYWDVFDFNYNGNPGYLYQNLDERIAYAQNFATKYAAYAEDWSGLVTAGEEIVEYALQYVGRIHYTRGPEDGSGKNNVGSRYSGSDMDQAIYTGGTPTIGVDCSSFIHGVFAHFGIYVPDISDGYKTSGATQIPVDESQLLPGDILWRDGHVAIYIGNGMCVEATQCNGGDHSNDLITDSIYDGKAFTKAYRYWE